MAHGDALDRIFSRVREEGDCWIFTGCLVNGRYGRVSENNRLRLVHVVVYERIVGPVPDGLELDHLCRRPACCNPFHLEAVPHLVNVRRGLQPLLAGSANSAKTHCPKGHPYDEANTIRRSNGRGCRECQRVHCREQHQRRRAVA